MIPIIAGGLGIGLLVGAIVIAATVAEALKQTLPGLLNARARRRAGASGSPFDSAEQAALLDELQGRLGDVDAMQRRLAEVEERLDFAERLLAQQRQVDRVGPASD
ncbi:MAG TPA: hypothetical protein VH116_00510 [Gemmatimonadales bacterium]|nr:hypothetical protein [Gemmatimonadales bacterium]